jgi:hypothetical protein
MCTWHIRRAFSAGKSVSVRVTELKLACAQSGSMLGDVDWKVKFLGLVRLGRFG